MPEPADPRPPLDLAVVAGLTTYWQVQVAPETPSTNAHLAERARGGASMGLVLVTEHQTAGRGRLGRTWETPPRAALTFSALVRPAAPPDRWPLLALLAGLAVHDGLRAATDLADVALKWPNDVLVGEQKVCGILVELVDAPTGAAAVIGVGLNVSTTRAELPVPTATSLALEGVLVDRSELLGRILIALAERFEGWRESRFDLLDDYAAACATVGQVVEVQLPGGEKVVGRALGLDADGRLEVESADGRRVIGAGDVVHVRPA